MIVEEIVNEIDKFITKYKSLKSDNQTLTQFKSDVKTALNVKGIINTNEDSEVVQSITNYTPSTTGSGASLDANYLKSVGLLPSSFSGNPTERDLIVNKFLFQDSTDSRRFISSEDLLSVSVHLDGKEVNNYRKVTRRGTSVDGFDVDKYNMPFDGYTINEFRFNKTGNYSVDMSIGTLSLSKVINYVEEDLSSMDNFLVYATNLKSNRVVCYDTDKVETINKLDKSKIDFDTAQLFNSVENNLNAMGGAKEKLGYVYNIRTGKAFFVDVVWLSSDFSRIREEFRHSLSTVIYDGRIDVLTSNYSFALSVSGDDKNHTTFISDIDYQDGDTLVFAFYKERNSEDAHEFSINLVEKYLKTISSAISSEPYVQPDLEGVTSDNYGSKLGAFVSSNNISTDNLDIIEYVDSLHGYINTYANGVMISIGSVSYKDNNPDLYKGLLKYLVKNYIKGFKSIIVFDFTSFMALDPIPVISDSIDLSEIAEGVGYLMIRASKDIVFKEGTKEAGKSDKITIRSSKLVDGKAPFLKVNGSEFESISGVKEYSFSNDFITDSL
jgi:hypothetical protein